MKIIRSQKPKQDYTVLRNDVLRDETISFRARGVLAYILSNADNWRTDAKTMSKIAGEGRQAIQTAINELKAAGYIESRKVQEKTTGRWTTEVVVYDLPKTIRETVKAQHTPEENIATDMVREIWEQQNQTDQLPAAVVKIVAKQIKDGVDKKTIAVALNELAKTGTTVTANRLNQKMRINNLRGKLQADQKVDWANISEVL